MMPIRTSKTPAIDLHGEYTSTVYTIINEFISDNVKLKEEVVIIVHGKGTGKLKNAVHEILKKDKRVTNYFLDPYNLGQTIVYLHLL